jgi:zinc transport system substrate-binding protein|tara:strand:+ start:180 stop:1136 length:957 start_codon:yes stop_codon:yes gene_type:complete
MGLAQPSARQVTGFCKAQASRRICGVVGAIFLATSTLSVSAMTPRVATDIGPVYSLAARVMAGIGVPDLIIRHGASPHAYSLRPSEAAALEKADLVFWVSEGLTPWLKSRLEILASKAHVVELMKADGAIELPYREGATFANHDDHSAVDPHGWLDPENGKVWLGVMASELSKIDPANTDLYFQNAAAGALEISEAVAQINKTLISVRGVRFIVFHDAYQYFERRFGISASGSILVGDALAPNPVRIVEIRGQVAELGIGCVLSEPQFNPALVASVFQDAEVRTAVIDSQGIELALGMDLYPQVLESIAKEIVACAEE